MTRLDLRHRIGLDINDVLQRDVRRTHPLEQLFWECTLRCNLACRHCGSDCRTEALAPDMPREDFLRVPHSVFVIVTGGEPLMRADLEECGRGIYEKGFAWGMVTNGFALTPERFQRLLDSGMRSATVSLDGLQDNHDWMRGRAHSFEHASAAIRMLADRKDFVFDVVTCVNQRNYDELPRIKEALIGWGVTDWRIFTVFPMGRAATDPLMQLPNDKFRGVLDFIKATRREGRIHASYGCEGFLGNYEGDVRDHFYSCEAGITAAFHLRLRQHPLGLPPGQHLPRRRPDGGLGAGIRALPRPRMDAHRSVRGLQVFQILPRRRDAPARRRRPAAVLSFEKNCLTSQL